jgi:putative acetyltransferase
MIVIRPERPADIAAIHALVAAAFPADDEARLVDALRDAGDAAISLVAEDAGEIVGHVLFSPMSAPFAALGLAPVATLEARRREGIAARLIEAGLAMARAQGVAGVFVLGDNAYYERFGFRAQTAAPFASPYAGAHFMALSLGQGGLPATSGAVDYAPAFAAL